MKVLIIEDEPLIAKNLQRLLRELEPEVEVLGVQDAVAGAVQWLKSNEAPDLLFMDIQLSDGVSFDIFEQVAIDKPVIFTTAYDEYAIRAFKVNSLDYLLKPIDKAELQKALTKYHKYFEAQIGNPTDITAIVDTLRQKTVKYKERFLVHHKSGMIPLGSDDISIFHKDQIIYLHTTDGQKYVTDYDTVDEIEEVVNPARFYRANRQTLINKNAVVSIQKHFSGKIEAKVKGHESLTIDISREKAQDFKTWLETA
jgi:DNA-binding LytR/AlgR family response regulator